MSTRRQFLRWWNRPDSGFIAALLLLAASLAIAAFVIRFGDTSHIRAFHSPAVSLGGLKEKTLPCEKPVVTGP